MAVEIGSAFLSIMPSMKGFGSKLESGTSRASERAGKTSGKRFGGGLVATASKAAGPLAAAFAGIKIGGFLTDAIGAASDLNEAGTKTTAIFGKDGAKALDDFAKGSAKRLGQTKQEILDSAGTFGVFGKAAGLSGKDLSGFATNFSTLASDMGSFFNTSPEEAAQAISAGLRGEAEPLRRYGVLLDDASMRNEALKMGLIKTTKQALTPQQKVLAAQALIYKQTGDAQGDFARTSGGLANQQRILAAQWKESKVALGNVLLPIAVRVVTFLNDSFMPALGKIKSGFSNMVGGVDGVKGKFAEIKGFLQPVVDSLKVFFATLSGKEVESTLPWADTLRIAAYDVRIAFFNLQIFFYDKVLPAFRAVSDFVRTYVIPAFAAIGRFILTSVIPALVAIGQAVGRLLAVVAPIVAAIVSAIVGKFKQLLPQIIAIWGSVKEIITGVLAIVKRVVELATAFIAAIWKRYGASIIRIVTGLMGAISKIIGGVMKVIKGIVNLVLGIITGDWSKAGKALRTIVSGIRDVLVGIWRAIKATIGEVLKNLLKDVRDRWTGLLRWAGSSLKSGLNKIKGYVVDPIKSAIGSVKTLLGKGRGGLENVFSTAMGAFGKVWGKLSGVVKTPVRDLVNKVLNDGLIDGFNQIAGKLSDKLKLPRISLPKGFSQGGPTGHGSKYKPAGIVHAGEYVFDHAAVTRFPGGIKGLDSLRHTVKTGNHGPLHRLPGYALGGGVTPAPGRIVPHGLPYNGARYAADLQGSFGSAVKAWKAGQVSDVKRWNYSYGNHIKINHGGENTLYAHLSKILVAAGQRVTGGQKIGEIGSTGNSTGPHLHFEVRGGSGPVNMSGGGGGDGGFDFLGAIKKKIDDVIGGVNKIIPDTGFGRIIRALPGRLKDGLIDKGKGLVGSGIETLKGVAGVARWTPQVVAALGMTGLPLSLTDNWLRQIQSESGGNPRAVQGNIGDINNRTGDLAKGLVQVIGATFNAYRSKVLPNDRFNPLSSLYAGMNYAKHRYGASSLERVIGHGHGYAMGTTSASPGLHLVGENGPEIRHTRNGDAVYTNSQLRSALTGPSAPTGPQRIEGRLRLVDGEAYIEGVVIAATQKASLSV